MRARGFAGLMLSIAGLSPVLADVSPADPAIAAAEALAPVPPGRLGDLARPNAYRLDLTVDPARERFSGHVEIEVELKRPSRFIDLHGRGLAMARAIARAGGKIFAGRWFELDPSGGARLVFDSEVPAGPLTLEFDYEAQFQTGPSGLFRAKVENQWHVWSQFQSIDARSAFPSFDEPGFKTPFTLTLRTPRGLSAVSNAPEAGKQVEGGLEVHRFAQTLPLPTYLVAMMVGPFATLEGVAPPTPQRQHSLPVRIVTTRPNAARTAFALEGSKAIIVHLEAYFAEAFPYPKLDQIASPIMHGAMENAGADLYADPLLILDDKASSAQKRWFGMVVSHELSHQWFGDLVTPAWWDDVWLNESFANWMGFTIGQQWRPDLEIGAGALAEGFAAMRTDALVAGRAIHQPITTNAQIDEAFDTITYGKGGHVVAMIAGYMGEVKFRDGVRRYMAAHRYGSATSTDFFSAMAEAAGDPRIVAAMQGFVDQQGVPLVTFVRAPRGAWTARQSRYARFGATAPETRWTIPLCVRSLTGRPQCRLLGEAETIKAPVGKGPLIPNAGGTGYYRFELPTGDWDALIARAGQLRGGEALALADSLNASFLAGRASPGQLIALARNLAASQDSAVADAGMESLGMLQASGLLDEAGQAGFSRLIRQVYGPRLTSLGFDPKAEAYAGEDPEQSRHRADLVEQLADTARDPALRQRLGRAAQTYLDGDTDALDPAWFELGFSVWLGRGGIEAARSLADRALASEDPLLRPAALGALASTGDPAIGRWLLEEFRDPRLRGRERFLLISGVIAKAETRDQGFAWLKAHFDEFLSGAGGMFYTVRVPALLGGFCSVDKADEIAALLRPKLAGQTGALELERTIERVRSCGVLKQARGAELSGALAAIR